MPQIPVFTGNQRIDPGSPVPLTSPESSAGNLQGNAVEAFGNAMFAFGNKLDEAGRAAKAQLDKDAVKIAVNDARYAMLEAKAAQNAQGVNINERADGFSAVDNFKTVVTPKLKEIQDKLTDPRLQKMFQAEIGDDFVKDSASVLAGEVDKREKAVPILTQNNINGKAALARKDFSMSERMMLEAAHDIQDNSFMSEADKLKATLNAQKTIADESIAGLLDSAKVGNTKNFFEARRVLRENYAQIYTAEEMRKKEDYIDKEQSQYFTLEHSMYVRQTEVLEKEQKAAISKGVSEYTNALALAKNDQFKFNAIQEKMQRDPRFLQTADGAAALKAIQSNRVFMETADDNYEGSFMTTLLKKRNFSSMIDKVNTDFNGGQVSSDRRDKLLKAVENLQERNQKDPYLMAAVKQYQDEINNYKKAPTLDPISGMYKSENDTYNEKAQSMFISNITAAANRGQLTVGGAEAIKQKVLKDFYGGEAFKTPVRGVNPSDISTAKGAQTTLETLYKDYKLNGKTWNADKKRQVMDQINKISINKKAAEQKEQLKINTPMNNGSNKVFDE